MNTTYVATAGLETAPLQDGSVLYNLKTGKFIMLNRSASFLWTELAAPVTQEDLLRRLCGAFASVEADCVRQEVDQALAQFKELELASSKDGVAGPYTTSTASDPVGAVAKADASAYESPSIRVLNEEELLNIFQMTAAEISVASCWWNPCTAGCP